MKTFKQFQEESDPVYSTKQFDVNKSNTMFIRTPDIIKKENRKFRSKYPVPFNFSLPQAKKKLSLKRVLNLNFL